MHGYEAGQTSREQTKMPRFMLEDPLTRTILRFAKTLLLVSSLVRSKQQLCFVHGHGQKRKLKHTTNTFVGFYNHSLNLNFCHLNIAICI